MLGDPNRPGSYRLSVGGGRHSQQMTNKLWSVLEEICTGEMPELVAEVLCDRGPIDTHYIDCFRHPWYDKTAVELTRRGVILWITRGDERHIGWQVIVRRAICRLVFQKMHAAGMDVQLLVTVPRLTTFNTTV